MGDQPKSVKIDGVEMNTMAGFHVTASSWTVPPERTSFPEYLRSRTPHEPPADSTEYDLLTGEIVRELRGGVWVERPGWTRAQVLAKLIEEAHARTSRPPWYARPWIVPTLASVALVLAVIGAIAKAWS